MDLAVWLEEGVWAAHRASVPGAYGLGETRAQADRDLSESLDELKAYLNDIGERPPNANK